MHVVSALVALSSLASLAVASIANGSPHPTAAHLLARAPKPTRSPPPSVIYALEDPVQRGLEKRAKKQRVLTVTRRVKTEVHGHPTTLIKVERTTATVKLTPKATQPARKAGALKAKAKAIAAHNAVRSLHGAKPLSWSSELAEKAQHWANQCKFEHSGGQLGPYGENLAAYAGSVTSITNAVNDWAAEVKDYNPKNPTYSHFTQLVWKKTTQVGCAVAECSGIFPEEYGPTALYVCEYNPQGNIDGKYFYAKNVQA